MLELRASDTVLPVNVRLVTEYKHVEPGKNFRVGVYFEIASGWHIYDESMQESGFPTQIEWMLPEGYRVEAVTFPNAKPFVFDNTSSHGYSDTCIVVATIKNNKANRVDDVVMIQAKVDWLACGEACVPGSGVVEICLPISQDASEKTEYGFLFENTFTDKDYGYWLLLAFLGGIILNLMPCVFPILGIKVMSFFEYAQQGLGSARKHAISFMLGILISFWVLGLIIHGFKVAGHAIGWGFQLQSPVFVICLIVLFSILTLNLLGVFEWTSLGGNMGNLNTHSLKESFFSGCLATLVATPCTGPFMGTALGVAFVQPFWVSMSIFTFLALGMAFPYGVLTLYPRLLNSLPRPGQWMNYLKKIMALPMLLSVLWLGWVLIVQVGLVNGFLTILGALMIVGAMVCYWMRFQLLRNYWNNGWRWGMIFLILVGISIIYLNTKKDELYRYESFDSNWVNFDPILLSEYIKKEQPVLLDFTAAWCITCQLNKRVALNNSSVIEAYKKAGVIMMYADWTNKDPAVTQALSALGRSGVPVCVLYRGRGLSPIILPTLLTPRIMIEALESLPKTQ